MFAKLLQLCPTLCNPVDCNLLGSSVHGILQARILGWVVISFFRGFSQPRDQTFVSYASCIGRQVPYHQYHLGRPPNYFLIIVDTVQHSVAQSCLTFCFPMDCSSPGSSVHGIFQARILEQVSISCSEGSLGSGIEPVSLESPASLGRLFTSSAPGKRRQL